MTNFNQTAKKLRDASAATDAVVAETRLHFDTLVQLQMDERQQSEERHAKEKQEIRSHYRRIVAVLAVTVCLCIATAGVILYGIGIYSC